jgi:glycosyltransferase involved in cell wall biosynthesis
MSRFKPMPKDADLVRELGLEGKFVAGYVGTHGMAHHLETLLDAAGMVQNQPGGEAFHFILLGDGARKQALQDEAARRGLDNVTFIDSVTKDLVARYWSLLDVSVIHLRKTELFTTVIPSKLFECMGMGLPVLHGVAGESADIVREEGVGTVFEPENATQLVEQLQFMQGDRQAYEGYRTQCLVAAKKFDRTTMAMKMLQVVLM